MFKWSNFIIIVHKVLQKLLSALRHFVTIHPEIIWQVIFIYFVSLSEVIVNGLEDDRFTPVGLALVRNTAKFIDVINDTF